MLNPVGPPCIYSRDYLILEMSLGCSVRTNVDHRLSAVYAIDAGRASGAMRQQPPRYVVVVRLLASQSSVWSAMPGQRKPKLGLGKLSLGKGGNNYWAIVGTIHFLVFSPHKFTCTLGIREGEYFKDEMISRNHCEWMCHILSSKL